MNFDHPLPALPDYVVQMPNVHVANGMPGSFTLPPFTFYSESSELSLAEQTGLIVRIEQ